jgi:murein DD-endopeptidase MepM/ murein hydrolase activator NlpD
MKNRFFTILIVPEKASKMRRFVIPAWLFRTSIASFFILFILAGIMILDYWYVMNQINENRDLKVQNRRLTQQVQIFQNKMNTLENTVGRIQTFSTRLKIITNIEDQESLVERLNRESIPDSTTNLPGDTSQATPSEQTTEAYPLVQVSLTSQDPEARRLQKDQDDLDERFSRLQHHSLLVEQELQDLYELLADQKAFLAALPTRKPAQGHFTSGFGVRRSPFGGGTRMHEGIDIANWSGTPIIATAAGSIVFSGRKPSYGKTVIIEHGYGLETWYSHADALKVRTGDKVRRGQEIALMGTTGRSTGPHVHYEVRVNGIPVDPIPYILEN